MGLDTITDKVVANLKKDTTMAFDPATIIIIAEMIMQFIEFFQKCNKTPKEAVAITSDPSWLQRRLLEIVIRRNLGWKANRTYGTEIYNAFINSGKEITVEDMQGAYLAN